MTARANLFFATFLLVVFATASHRVSSMQRIYYSEEVRIGAMPATLFLPVPPPLGRFGPPDPPTPRPPLVIVQHGFSASRQAMGWIARGLVRNGFAVLAADFRGHGQNPTPFNFSELGDDITALITYAATRPEVDASRVALVGHSMGAAATYLYAVHHDTINAVVPISGSAPGGDVTHPHNALLIYASHDPPRTREMSRAAMDRLTASTTAATAGDLSAGNARRIVEVSGHDHVSILFSDTPVRETVDWLRGTWGMPAAQFSTGPGGMLREGLIALVAGLLLFFPLAGFLASAVLRIRQAPGVPQRGAVWMVGVAMLVAGAALFGGTPLSFLPYAAGNELLSFLSMAGVVYAVWLGVRRPPEAGRLPEWLRGAALGGAAFTFVYFTVGAPVSRLFFNLMLSSQRFGWFVIAAVLLLPLGIGMEAALRPPGGLRAVVGALAAKALIIVGMAIAINDFGTLPPVIGLMIPSFIIVLPILEAVAARLYTVSGSAVASGVLTAMWLAWIPAAIFPIGY